MIKQAVLGVIVSAASLVAMGSDDLVAIPGGSYVPFYPQKRTATETPVPPTLVEPFLLDRDPVTNRRYLEFVSQHAEWRRSSIKRVFADSGYLQHWDSDLSILPEDLDKPVVNISWFAAEAFCEAKQERLPMTDEWEYVLEDLGRGKASRMQQVLQWYSIPNRELPSAGSSPPNGFGIRDMVGVIWEWTEDFNSFMASADSRDSGQRNMFCGGGSLNASDPTDYASFMRYSFRSSLQGDFTGRNLGFRCAKDLK
jgi:formylglycine-generating enzyme required for sulfatase activity